MTDFAATFRKPFAEQVAAYRLRLGNPVPTARFDDISRAQHDTGWMVAGAVKADLLADLGQAVDRAIAKGTGFEAFKSDFRGIVEKHGWHGWTGEGTAKGEAWRMRVIYRTNMATSYAAGRMAQLVDGQFKYWVYRHGNALEPRLQHLAWDGVALAPDHPFWASHSPPNDWGCTCYVTGARTEAGIKRVGGTVGKPLPEGWDALNPKTGAPVGVGKGWDYAPGASVAAALIAVVAKIPKLPAPIGARLYKALPPRKVEPLEERFSSFVDAALGSPVRKEAMVIGALKPEWIDAAKVRGVDVTSAEIAVTDLNVQHTFRGTGLVTHIGTKPHQRQAKIKPIDLAWYKALPKHLLKPRAVLFDQTKKEPVFLLIFDVPGSLVKLVVEIDTPLKKARGVLNTIQSGRLIGVDDVKSMIGRGIEVIDGGV